VEDREAEEDVALGHLRKAGAVIGRQSWGKDRREGWRGERRFGVGLAWIGGEAVW